MEWDIFRSEDGSGNWVVQAMNFDGDGEIYTVTFSDFDAKARASITTGKPRSLTFSPSIDFHPPFVLAFRQSARRNPDAAVPDLLCDLSKQ